MKTSSQTNNLPFLQGGGEMGELIRQHDWSQASIGTPGQWPQSLQTTLGILLHSAFPMFLFWGDELLCFYNDAFRPSLGIDGKHPAIGKQGKEVWQEIWDFVGPLIASVITTGKPVWFEDQLVPFYRNGKIEDIYWTFSYSPAYGDGGKINGVFVTCTETTEKVLNQKAIEKSEKKYRTLFNSIDDGFCIIEKVNSRPGEPIDFRYLEANPSFGQQTGIQNVTGKTIREILPAETDEWFGIYDDIIKTGMSIRVERYVPYIDRVLEMYAFRVEDEATQQVAVIFKDITQRKKSEEALKESEDRFRTMAEGSDILIAVADETSNAVYFNNAWVKLTGRSLEELRSFGWADLIHPEDKQQYLDIYFSAFKKRESFSGGFRILNKEGEYRWLLATAPPRFHPDGSFAGYISSCIDITDQVLAAKKMEETGIALQGAIELAELSTWKMNIKDGTFQYSPRFMDWLGFSEDTKTMDEAYNPLPDEYRQSVADAIAEVVKKGSPGIYENEHPIVNRLTGQVRIILAQAQVFYDEAGEPLVLSGTARDVTKERALQKELEFQVQERTRELAEANKALQRNNQELEQFAYVASHDLQEPLRKVSTFADLLKNHLGPLDEKSGNYFNKITNATTRMMQLIRDVLNFSQLSAAHQNFEPLDLNNLLDHLVADFELVIEQKEASVHYDQLPMLKANPLQMRQLFGNLLSNALKFTKQNVPPIISITAEPLKEEEKNNRPALLQDLDYYMIRVADNGIGFDQENADKIFSIFQRLNAKSEFAGTGIGLALCKKIAHNHQGEIEAISQRDKGSVFSVFLPIK